MNKLISFIMAIAAISAVANGTIAYATPPGGAANPYAGSYEGVLSINTGPDAPGVTTLTMTILSDGTVSGGFPEGIGGTVIDTFAGSITGAGVLTITQTANGTGSGTFQLTVDPTTQLVTGLMTQSSNGNIFSLWFFKVPSPPSPYAGSYSGGFTTATSTGTLSISVANNGDATIAGSGQSTSPPFTVGTLAGVGYSDNSGHVLLAYISGGTPSIGVGTLQLNGSALTYAGQEYVNDQVNNTPFSVTLAATSAVPHTFAAGVTLFSVPTDYSGMSLDSVLGYPTPHLAVWDPTISASYKYVVSPVAPADAIRLNQAYWVRIPTGGATLTASGTPAPDAWTIGLVPGWNMVGCPQATAIALSSLSVVDSTSTARSFSQAASLGYVQDPLYTFQPGDVAYEVVTGASGSLRPWYGYWLFATTTCTLEPTALSVSPFAGTYSGTDMDTIVALGQTLTSTVGVPTFTVDAQGTISGSDQYGSVSGTIDSNGNVNLVIDTLMPEVSVAPRQYPGH